MTEMDVDKAFSSSRRTDPDRTESTAAWRIGATCEAHPRRGGLLARIRHCLPRVRDARGGAAALEFALGLPVFAALVYGLFEVSRIFLTLSTLEYAVEEAARFAIVNNDATAEEIQQFVTDSAAGLNAAQIDIDVTFEQDTTGAGAGTLGFVTVTGTFAYTPVVKVRGIGDFDITTSTRMAVVQPVNP